MTRKILRAGCTMPAALAVLAVSAATAAAQPAPADVFKTYADIAQAGYEDSLATAKELAGAIDAFLAGPSLVAAKDAWLAARVPYQQTEAYRFGNAIVDDWEGRVNAWPLDEGLIDYVDPGYGTESDENDLYVANVIANPTLTISGETVDASEITPALLSDTLQEAGEIEANVATGYHAIEFLLWGQDLNGTGPGAGMRPYTDYDTANCTNGNCGDGAARTELMEGDPAASIAIILTGMGSLSSGEVAGERMKLGLLLHDPEEEHDCFSDNTYNSHYYDALGIQNVYLGTYKRVDGSEVSGASVSDLVKAKAPEVDAELREKLQATLVAMHAMKDRAEGGEAYDQMIGEGNDEGNAVVQAAIDALIAQTQSIEDAVAALDLDQIAFEGSDSLDNPDAVFQ